MALRDRLDAIDRRFLWGPPKRPPNRLRRWTAMHPWTAGVLFGLAMSIPRIVMHAVGDDARSVVVTVVMLPVLVGFGYLLARIVANAVAAWDQEHAPPNAPP